VRTAPVAARQSRPRPDSSGVERVARATRGRRKGAAASADGAEEQPAAPEGAAADGDEPKPAKPARRRRATKAQGPPADAAAAPDVVAEAIDDAVPIG
jgi:hypothetical protein